nr:hypothetical protein [uncultured Roseobacter sp.]
MAFQPAAIAPDLQFGISEIVQDGLNPFEKGQPLNAQRDHPAAAMEQNHAEVLFQFAEPVTHSCRRQALFLGGSGDATALRDLNKCLKVVDTIHLDFSNDGFGNDRIIACLFE